MRGWEGIKNCIQLFGVYRLRVVVDEVQRTYVLCVYLADSS